jgi:hypothetical protein
MANKNKKYEERKEQSERLHQPQSDSTRKPVNLRSGDKLKENPSNDEETIEQNPRKGESGRTAQSPLSKEHDGSRNQVTNEDDQKEIVNPKDGDWDEPEKEPAPQKDPNEEISDDPDGTQRKIPKM